MRYFIVTAILVLISTVSFGAAKDNAAVIYDSKGNRDPFVPLIGNVHSKLTAVADVMSVDDVQFQGIAIDDAGNNSVLLNGEMLRKGDTIGAVSIVDISEEYVTVTVQGKEYTLDVSEYE